MNRMRLFTGIELPGDVSAALVAVGALVRREVPSWRDEKWVARENLHVTLKFIGDVDVSVVTEIQAALGVAMSRVWPFALEPAGMQAIPGTQRASMFWAAFDDPSGDCARLARTAESALERFGVEVDRRVFKPHVTLARARRPHAFPAEIIESLVGRTDTAVASMSVSSLTLFSSTLTRSGPVYEVVEKWTLAEPCTGCET